MGGGIVAQRETGQGSRLEMHRRGGVGHYAVRCLALYFGECRLPRFGQSAVRSGRDDRFGGRLAQDFAGLGATIEQRLERTAAASHATPGMERRHRLALAALLRTTVPKPQRTVLRPAQAGDREVSRLRLGLHCGIRTALHTGADLGATPRVDGPRVASPRGENSRNWPENQAFAAGSRVSSTERSWSSCRRNKFPL